MAYINISSDGQRLVGPLGLKKAEQELIKRRYKYSYNQDSISRVALVYGQPHGGGSVGRASDNMSNQHEMYQYASNHRSSNGSGVGVSAFQLSLPSFDSISILHSFPFHIQIS